MIKGEASAKNKQLAVEKLLVAAQGEEVRYLIRTLSLNLRVGAVRTTILIALARALVLTPPHGEEWRRREVAVQAVGEGEGEGEGKRRKKVKKEADPEREDILQRMEQAEGLLKQVYVRHPHFGHIVDGVLEVGLEGLADKVQLTVGECLPLDRVIMSDLTQIGGNTGTPLHPTLGSPTRSLDEIYERLGNLAFSAEFKYDGQRVQIHAQRTPGDEEITVRLFSRHLEDMTSKVSIP
jgi:DNA ligase-1